MSILKLFWARAAGAVGLLAFHGYALAQLALPENMGIQSAIIGDNTDGAETGLSEIVAAITPALTIILTIFILVQGYKIAKTFFWLAYHGTFPDTDEERYERGDSSDRHDDGTWGEGMEAERDAYKRRHGYK